MEKTHYAKTLKATIAGQAKKIQEMSLENEGLLYEREDLEKKVKALEFAHKHAVDERNRYARLYDQENEAKQEAQNGRSSFEAIA